MIMSIRLPFMRMMLILCNYYLVILDYGILLFSPVLLIIYFSYPVEYSGFSWEIFGIVVLNSIFDVVISDYLWARAVILTSATIATVGLSITIPLAMISDDMQHGIIPDVISVVGALLVIVGFVGMNVYHV